MDWGAEGTRQAVGRIVALLLLFAALAEHAAALPHPVRSPLLWLLRRAESVAREFVTGEARDDIFRAQGAQRHGDGEAARLALSFRVLGAELEGAAAEDEYNASYSPGQVTCDISASLPGLARKVLAPDTS